MKTIIKMDQTGFTIAELIVVIVVTAIMSGTVIFFTMTFWRSGYRLEADLDTLITRLDAGDFLRESVGFSSGLIIQNSLADSHTNNPDPAYASNNYWIPVHAIPGNKPVGATGTTSPLIYFRRPSLNSSGAYILNGSQPYEDEFVLYFNGTTKSLLQRTVANPSASGNRIKTTCPASLATASCPADKVVAADVTSIDMRYFSRTGNLIDYTSIYDPVNNVYTGPDFTAVEVVEFQLNLAKKPVFQKTNSTVNSTIIRIALRNA